MNPAQWKTSAQRLLMDVSSSYVSKKHLDKLVKKPIKSIVPSKVFDITVTSKDLLQPNMTAGMPLNSMFGYSPMSAHWYYTPKVVYYTEHRNKAHRVHTEIKRIHNAICSCKRFMFGVVKNAEYDSELQQVSASYRVSCDNLDLLEFQMLFEDSLHEYV